MRKFRRHRPGKGSEGFSLIEVMIALSFLGIGLLAIAQLIPLGMAGITEARVRTIAVQAAQQRMDELKTSSFSSAVLTAGNYTETVDQYTIVWTITDDDPVPGSKRVDMTATWPHLSGTRSASLTTYVTARR
jgi:prepilin-type N-terminal cleavage/methylation domain-containing protein